MMMMTIMMTIMMMMMMTIMMMMMTVMMIPNVTFQPSQKHDLTYISKHKHHIILTFIHLNCKTFQHTHAPDNSDVEGGQGKGEFVHHIT
jgi:hypothetical protein